MSRVKCPVCFGPAKQPYYREYGNGQVWTPDRTVVRCPRCGYVRLADLRRLSLRRRTGGRSPPPDPLRRKVGNLDYLILRDNFRNLIGEWTPDMALANMERGRLPSRLKIVMDLFAQAMPERRDRMRQVKKWLDQRPVGQVDLRWKGPRPFSVTEEGD